MQFDICIANILRGPLLDLQPRLTAYVKPGGHLLLSGILESQVRCRPRFDDLPRQIDLSTTLACSSMHLVRVMSGQGWCQ